MCWCLFIFAKASKATYTVHNSSTKNTNMSDSELACVYSALILFDAEINITVRNHCQDHVMVRIIIRTSVSIFCIGGKDQCLD